MYIHMTIILHIVTEHSDTVTNFRFDNIPNTFMYSDVWNMFVNELINGVLERLDRQ